LGKLTPSFFGPGVNPHRTLLFYGSERIYVFALFSLYEFNGVKDLFVVSNLTIKHIREERSQ